MPHFQDVIAGHYVDKAELDRAETAELGTLHLANNTKTPCPQSHTEDRQALQWLYRKLAARAVLQFDDSEFLRQYAAL